MPSVSGGLSQVYNITPGRQVNIQLPIQDASLLDSVILYNYSSLLCAVYTSGIYQGWLSPWSVDRFRIGNQGSVIVQPQAAAGAASVVSPVSQEIVAAYLLSDEAESHTGHYPQALVAPDQQALSLLQAQAASMQLPAGLSQTANPAPPAPHPILSAPWTTPAGNQKQVTFQAQATNTYASGQNVWDTRNDFVFQGYDGYNLGTGCWFYGNVFTALLSGKTIDAVTIQVSRTNFNGNSGKVALIFYEHGYDSQPAGAPAFVDSSNHISPGSLAYAETATFSLPVAWGNNLAAGTTKGFALYDPSGNNYLSLNGRKEDPYSGFLTVSYH